MLTPADAIEAIAGQRFEVVVIRGGGTGLTSNDARAPPGAARSRRERRAAKEEDEEFSWPPDRHRTIDGAEAAELVPALAPREPASASLFYDCQTDDARLVLTILGEAERFGAVMLNGAEVTGLVDRDGHAAGVAFVEAESGRQMQVEAANVVKAT